MITIREISTNPCRDIVEGITKLETLRFEPVREFVCLPAPSDEAPVIELPTQQIIQKFSTRD
ncbi:MAG TPA: hypothetical protein VG347_05060 [Verrucomicrobiae bacterium]|nr:hypothetical protein [Verrucomicrobiae bacterium]